MADHILVDATARAIGANDLKGLMRATADRTFAPSGYALPARSAGFATGSVGGLARAALPSPRPAPGVGVQDLPGAAAQAAAPANAQADVAQARADGYAEGLAAGLDQGRAEGRAEGHATGLDEGHARGHAAGLAEARAAQDAELGAARATFEALIASFAHPSAREVATLRRTIQDSILHLAAARAGQAIDDNPAPFVARVDAMVDRLSHGVTGLSLRLNPDDLAAITPHLGQSDTLSTLRIDADPLMARGDLDLRIDGVRLTDLLAHVAVPPVPVGGSAP